MGGGASKRRRPSGDSNKASEASSSTNSGAQQEAVKKQVTAKVDLIEKLAPRMREEQEGSLTIKVNGVERKLPFAFMTQAGYYPDALDKKNQDALLVKGKCGGREDLAFFGVFDGHGKRGDSCSQFAKLAVCDALERDSEFTDGNYYSALVNAHIKANVEMHEQEKLGLFSDYLSGTTSIAALLHEDTVFVANVGDSRAISIMEFSEDWGATAGQNLPNGSPGSRHNLIASPLSIDQTPYRADERIRVKKCGARVLTKSQLEGYQDMSIQDYGNEEDNDGDPPRLWHPDGRYPGTAFTRSLGDRVAESIGVCAVPEVLERKLTKFDKYLLIASDGVFEFITSQGVVDIFEAYKSDLLGACRAIVAEAYRQWLQFEVRTDDITVVIVDLQDVHNQQQEHWRGQVEEQAEEQAGTLPRPVFRRVGTEAIAVLAEELSSQFLEKHTRESARKVRETESLSLKWDAEEKDGSAKRKGSFRAKIESHEKATDRSGDGDERSEQSEFSGVGHEKEASIKLDHSSSFKLDQNSLSGSLLSSSHERTLSNAKPKSKDMQMRPVRRKVSDRVGVVNFKPAELEGFEMPCFLKSESDAESIRLVIQNNYLFAHLDENQIVTTINAMREVRAEVGDIVIQQFDKGDSFYVAVSGRYIVEVSVPKTTRDPSGVIIPIEGHFEEPREVMEYSCEHGVYPSFGELALMYNRPRAATIRCVEAGKLWALERKAFHSILGRDSAHHMIKILRKVEAFKQLEYNEIARLVDLLVEVEFKPGQQIVKQGDKGDEFYVVKQGTAVVTIDDPQEPGGKEVMQLAEYDYFGELALINMAPRAANVIAKDRVVCLMIRKPLFDEVLGRIKDTLKLDARRREGVAEAYLGVKSLEDLRIFQGEIPFFMGQLYKCELRQGIPQSEASQLSGGRFFGTLRRIVLPENDELRSEAEVALKNELKILRIILSPRLITCFSHPSDPLLRYQLFKDEIVTDMKSIITDRPLDPSSNMLKYTIRVIVDVLLRLHQNRGVLCRGVSPEAIMVDSSGMLLLTDFRFAKVTAGARTFTICGSPDYMSPEQIKGTGHGFAADFWALGVLMVELFLGASPWGDAAEVQIYECVTNPVTLKMIINNLCVGLDKPIQDLIQGLLKTEPERRTIFARESDIEATPFFNRVRTKNSPFSALATKKAKGLFTDSSTKDMLNI